jgi:hypothetical protein
LFEQYELKLQTGSDEKDLQKYFGRPPYEFLGKQCHIAALYFFLTLIFVYCDETT